MGERGRTGVVPTLDEVMRRLPELADELDRVTLRQQELLDERVELWKAGKAHRLNATEMGKLSRVEGVTVRQRLMKERAAG